MNNSHQFRIWGNRMRAFTNSGHLTVSGGQLLWLHTGNKISISNLGDGEYIVQQFIGRNDKKDKQIFVGDIVKLHNKSEYVKKEYWHPVFEVTWDGFSFGLKHLGGGKNGDGNLFILRYRPNEFEVIGNIFESTIILPKIRLPI